MSEEKEIKKEENNIYEVGYHLLPILSDEDAAKKHASFKDMVEKSGAEIIEDQTASKTSLAYEISQKVEGERKDFSSSYFGWLKFACQSDLREELDNTLSEDDDVLRHILITTVRERTFAPREVVAESAVEGREDVPSETIEEKPTEVVSKEEKKELTEDDKKVIDESIDELVSE